MLKGIEAVLDKDLSSALVAVQVNADEFYILTDVPKVYISKYSCNGIENIKNKVEIVYRNLWFN